MSRSSSSRSADAVGADCSPCRRARMPDRPPASPPSVDVFLIASTSARRRATPVRLERVSTVRRSCDRRQHGGALLHGAFDARLHFRTPPRRGGPRARRAGGNSRSRPCDTPRRRRRAARSPDLVAQEQDGDGEHDERRSLSHAPGQEDPRIGVVGVGTRREHRMTVSSSLMRISRSRTADCVDPERHPRSACGSGRTALRRAAKNGFGPAAAGPAGQKSTTSRDGPGRCGAGAAAPCGLDL